MNKLVLSIAFMAFFALNTATAQYINGHWEGVQVSAKKPFPKNMTFDWDTRKYSYNVPPPFSTFIMELHLEGTNNNLTGIWRAVEKYGKVKPSVYEISGSFNEATHLMVWQPQKVLQGAPFANTINRTMTLMNDGTYEYFEGRWVAQDGTNGIMFFRRLPPADDKVLKASSFVGSHPDGSALNLTIEMEQLLAGEEEPKGTYTYTAADGTSKVQHFKFVIRENNVYTFSTEGINGNTDTWKVTVDSEDEITVEFQSADSSGPIKMQKS